ncbi:hypothetical protein Acy02nite_83560 [Actinoplanes cyaneus]|uniref:Uncharacterized protein n=1 Tax=Actinoplanes cyaneus TaxID=52696 RepID=A0A919M5I0_9ACTN|nr:hypothetical protein [Actinoplanes cyaneus]MCW2143142.1 hypothetical protein [Actinoplanes cyaneus]GID70475.1 hypothetical protein Acy02nite_83560 [Actinoplanes cyaneus]
MTDLDEIHAVARELAWAGRWRRALSLLDTTDGGFQTAVTAAEVALESDVFCGTELAAGRLAAAARLGTSWDLDFLHLRQNYFSLLQIDGTWTPGPGGKDPAALEELRSRAERMAERAPDPVRHGWARHYQGLTADNLLGRPELAPPHYQAALAAGEDTDPRLEREALRHLGGHDRDNGDLAAAYQKWARATALSAQAGLVPGLLTQLILLAVLARDEGDEAGAAMLAREIARAAEAIGAHRPYAQARSFLSDVPR